VKTGRLIIWVAPVFFLLASSELFAQSTVDSRLQKLEETIRVLERRVASLEDQLREQHASAPVAAGKVNWRKLHQGMSEGDVEQLLGSPSKVDAFGSFTVWHYGEYPSEGQVEFNDKRTVKGWHEP
jgi:hypothetical protein